MAALQADEVFGLGRGRDYRLSGVGGRMKGSEGAMAIGLEFSQVSGQSAGTKIIAPA